MLGNYPLTIPYQTNDLEGIAESAGTAALRNWHLSLMRCELNTTGKWHIRGDKHC